jgi:predicted O-methyltransferase YrrM
MDFLPDGFADYIAAHCTPEPDYLKALHRETWSKVLMPRMISGHVQGRFLALISRMIRPLRIVEIGTFTGYSALCLAEGLAPNGRLDTIDINDELTPMVRRYVESAGFSDRIRLHTGNALELLPTLEGPFDLAFIDADKKNYMNYYRMLRDRMRPGGWILADNVLWSGKVVRPAEKPDADTRALLEFNEAVHADPLADHFLAPIRDGIMIIRMTN